MKWINQLFLFDRKSCTFINYEDYGSQTIITLYSGSRRLIPCTVTYIEPWIDGR